MHMKKLTKADRAEIKRRLQAGEKQADLAEEYGVSQSTINRTANSGRKNTHEVIDDPNPALTTEMHQKRFWAKFHKFQELIETRKSILGTNTRTISDQIHRFESLAKQAPTTKLTEAYQQRADTYRLELASLNDLTELDAEILEMLFDLKSRAEVLIKVRKAGLGKPNS